MKYIKVTPHPHGKLGHQFQNMSLGMVLSELCSIKYIHTPFSGRSAKWENVFNFSNEFSTKNNFTAQIKLPRLNLGSNPTYDINLAKKNLNVWINIIKNGPDGAVYVTPFDSFPGFLGENIINLSDTLKKCYWADKSKFEFDKDFTNVGLHIRRGDISKAGNANRWLELSDYNKLMSHLRNNTSPEKPYKFHIFSEGSIELFRELENEDVVFQLDGSDVEAFRMMSSIDILVTGLSTFSILAAYVTNSPVLYHKLMNYTRWDNVSNFTNVDSIYDEQK